MKLPVSTLVGLQTECEVTALSIRNLLGVIERAKLTGSHLDEDLFRKILAGRIEMLRYVVNLAFDQGLAQNGNGGHAP